MSNDRRLILQMLAEGKITAEEADKLLAALETSTQSPESDSGAGKQREAKKRPRFMRILVQDEAGGDAVNIRVPLMFLRAGMRLGSLLPGRAHACVVGALKDKGWHIGAQKMKAEDLEQLIDNLEDLSVDASDEGSRVRIFCE